MQAAGYLISAAAEFSAGMQHGHDRLYGRDSGLFVNAYRHAAAIVTHTDDIALLDNDVDLVRIPCQRFIDAIIYDFPDKVVKAP